MKIYRYSGAGNNFIIVDGRNVEVPRFRRREVIRMLCSMNGTDGLMILSSPVVPDTDFRMEFFNPDGSCGMMCGNGGRCIVAFADLLGVKPSHRSTDEADCGYPEYVFSAADGLHCGKILSHMGEFKLVRLSMSDISGWEEKAGGIFLNTGARHLVLFVDDVDAVDVAAEGPRYRNMPEFAPEGTNVDFVQATPGGLKIRTFEKGVEAETAACGTGIVAASAASYIKGNPIPPEGYRVRALQDELGVELKPSGNGFTEVFLTGPTLCEGQIL